MFAQMSAQSPECIDQFAPGLFEDLGRSSEALEVLGCLGVHSGIRWRRCFSTLLHFLQRSMRGHFLAHFLGDHQFYRHSFGYIVWVDTIGSVISVLCLFG